MAPGALALLNEDVDIIAAWLRGTVQSPLLELETSVVTAEPETIEHDTAT